MVFRPAMLLKTDMLCAGTWFWRLALLCLLGMGFEQCAVLKRRDNNQDPMGHQAIASGWGSLSPIGIAASKFGGH